MKSRDMLIAEAVKQAVIKAWGQADESDGRRAIYTVDLHAIIASVPAPEPYCWVVQGCTTPFYDEFAENDAEQEVRRVGGTFEAIPLYKSPPASEINRQLLDAAKEALESGNDGDWQSARKALASAIAAAEKELK